MKQWSIHSLNHVFAVNQVFQRWGIIIHISYSKKITKYIKIIIHSIFLSKSSYRWQFYYPIWININSILNILKLIFFKFIGFWWSLAISQGICEWFHSLIIMLIQPEPGTLPTLVVFLTCWRKKLRMYYWMYLNCK